MNNSTFSMEYLILISFGIFDVLKVIMYVLVCMVCPFFFYGHPFNIC